MSGWRALDPVWSPEWLWISYATALRATVVLAAVAMAMLFLRRAPASVRAALWFAALLALLQLPGIRLLELHWSARIVPPVLSAPMVAIGSTMVAQSAPDAVPFPWTSVVGLVWMIGVVLVIGRLAREWMMLRLLVRRARPVGDPAWTALLAECRRAMGVRRPVRLLRGDSAGTPLTWGTLRPAVLLPADADAWPHAHRRAVLLHELAHVRRLDCLLALFAQGTCALWWCHPGAWWAASRLAAERERACDERVLLAGVRPSDYAACLLDIAERARGRAVPSVAAGLAARRSGLRGRLRRILDPATPLQAPPRAASAMAMAAAVVLALAVGSMRLSPGARTLWTALESPHWTTRAYAAESITRFGDGEALAALQARLRTEPHPGVGQMARYGAKLRARDLASR